MLQVEKGELERLTWGDGMSSDHSVRGSPFGPGVSAGSPGQSSSCGEKDSSHHLGHFYPGNSSTNGKLSQIYSNKRTTNEQP